MNRLLPDYSLVVLGTVAAVALGTGLVLGLTGRFGERVGPPPAQAAASPDPAGSYRIVALGDSITAGTGDLRAGGYAGRLTRHLVGAGRQATLLNLAVNGAESGDVLARLDSEGPLRAVSGANLILVSAGGNDLVHTLRPSSGRELLEPEQAARRMRVNLNALVTRLRATNPNAPIRLIGLYNPFELAPGEEAAARSQILAWNNIIDEATHAHRGVLAIPVFDLFDGRFDRLASDHYHPGPRGHELMARRVLDTLPEGSDAPGSPARTEPPTAASAAVAVPAPAPAPASARAPAPAPSGD